MEPISKKGLFMGYPNGVKGYRMWLNDERTSIIRRDVIFQESKLTEGKECSEILEKNDQNNEFQLEVELENKPTDPNVVENPDDNQAEDNDIDTESEEEGLEEDCLLCRDRVGREIKPP